MPTLPETHRARGIYLLPNLFTLSALFAGFYAVVSAMKGNFEHSAIAIFVAMIMDSLDGRVARLTNTQTPFGAELDSLSDMVSFGVAPALVIYSFALSYVGKLGWLVAFIYAAAGALRLARFNIRHSHDKRYFQGLPIPAAAAIVASLVWVCVDYSISGFSIRWIAFCMTLIVGLLMVSNVHYRSFKDLDLKGNVSFMVILFIVFIFVLISIDPPDVFLLLFVIYGISGPLTEFWHIYRKRRFKRQRQASSKESNDHDKS
jgi:CDP-diacylglycerol---serine O-phosphatidyltransferase